MFKCSSLDLGQGGTGLLRQVAGSEILVGWWSKWHGHWSLGWVRKSPVLGGTATFCSSMREQNIQNTRAKQCKPGENVSYISLIWLALAGIITLKKNVVKNHLRYKMKRRSCFLVSSLLAFDWFSNLTHLTQNFHVCSPPKMTLTFFPAF